MNTTCVKNIFLILLSLFAISCSSKKEIYRFQDAEDYNNTEFSNTQYTIQPNDILKIDIRTPDFESADGAFSVESNPVSGVSLDILKLEGNMVSPDYLIKHNVLGSINVKDKTTDELELQIIKILKEQNQLKDPTVNVKIINAKFTVGGQVMKPGTYNMVERITILQALGYAGDLTINGVRNDIMILRQHNGKQEVGHIDLTSVSFTQSPYYYLKQNDQIYVKPNGPRVKTAGYITNLPTALGIFSGLLTTYLLISNIK